MVYCSRGGISAQSLVERITIKFSRIGDQKNLWSVPSCFYSFLVTLLRGAFQDRLIFSIIPKRSVVNGEYLFASLGGAVNWFEAFDKKSSNEFFFGLDFISFFNFRELMKQDRYSEVRSFPALN